MVVLYTEQNVDFLVLNLEVQTVTTRF